MKDQFWSPFWDIVATEFPVVGAETGECERQEIPTTLDMFARWLDLHGGGLY